MTNEQAKQEAIKKAYGIIMIFSSQMKTALVAQ